MAYPVLDPATMSDEARAARARLCALAVMAKAPRPGKVKTRLSPPLTSEQAAKLNTCFLMDTTQTLSGVPGAAGVISYTPLGFEHLFEGLLPESFSLVLQREGDFGERLLGAAIDILACGFGSVCLIDSDSPTVPKQAFEQAVAELARPGDRVVLGPTMDGGYYLVGMKRAHAAVFERIAWSTETVYAETCARAIEAGVEVIELPKWYDVDDNATLGTLREELIHGKPPEFAPMPGAEAPRTRDYLVEIGGHA